MKLGNKIYRQRVKKNILQKDLAKALNISPQFLGRIEKGDVTLPADKMKKVSGLLEIQLDKLVSLAVQDYRLSLRSKIH